MANIPITMVNTLFLYQYINILISKIIVSPGNLCKLYTVTFSLELFKIKSNCYMCVCIHIYTITEYIYIYTHLISLFISIHKYVCVCVCVCNEKEGFIIISFVQE